MRQQLQTRLEELKKEFAKGQAHLQELEKQQAHLREMVLRISGAIQVLEELLAEAHSIEQNGEHTGEKHPISGQAISGNIMNLALQTPSMGGHDHETDQR